MEVAQRVVFLQTTREPMESGWLVVVREREQGCPEVKAILREVQGGLEE